MFVISLFSAVLWIFSLLLALCSFSLCPEFCWVLSFGVYLFFSYASSVLCSLLLSLSLNGVSCSFPQECQRFCPMNRPKLLKTNQWTQILLKTSRGTPKEPKMTYKLTGKRQRQVETLQICQIEPKNSEISQKLQE